MWQRRPRTTASNQQLSFLPPNNLGRYGGSQNYMNRSSHHHHNHHHSSSSLQTLEPRERLPPAQRGRGRVTSSSTATRRRVPNAQSNMQQHAQQLRRVQSSRSSRYQQQQLVQQRQRWQEKKNTYANNLQRSGGGQRGGGGGQRGGGQRGGGQRGGQRGDTLRRSRSAAGNRHAAPARVAQPLLGTNSHHQMQQMQHTNRNILRGGPSPIAPIEKKTSGVLQCTTGAFVATHGHACGAVSAPGHKPSKPGWKNQDAFLLMENFTHAGKEAVSLLGVFDGHGPCGGEVSSFCRDNISWVLQDCTVQVRREQQLFFFFLSFFLSFV